MNKAPALPGCPLFEGTRPLKINLFQFDPSGFPPGTALVRVAEAYDDFTLDAATRYLVRRFTFDHSQSVVGNGDPAAGTRGHAETPMCLSFVNVELSNVDGTIRSPAFENPGIT